MGKKHTTEARAKMLAAQNRPEVKKRRSEAQKKRYADPEECRKQSEAQKKRYRGGKRHRSQ